MDDFKLLASTSDTDDAAQACSIKHSQPTAAGCASSKQDAAPAADAAAVISRCSTACSVSFCSSGTGKPQGSRLSRSSSTGCNLQGLSSCSTTTDLFSTSPDNCKHAQGVEGAGTGDRHCSTVPGDDAEHDRIGQILADRHVNGPPEALHHKLSSPDRCALLVAAYDYVFWSFLDNPTLTHAVMVNLLHVYCTRHCPSTQHVAAHLLLVTCTLRPKDGVLFADLRIPVAVCLSLAQAAPQPQPDQSSIGTAACQS